MASVSKTSLTTAEAHAMYGYTKDYLSRLLRDGEIQGKKIGRSWHIDIASLEDFIRAQENQRTHAAKTLAEQRTNEYQILQAPEHVQGQSPDTKQKTMPICETHPMRTRFLAVSIACAVLTLAAVAAERGVPALFVERIIAETALTRQEIAFGFSETFESPSQYLARRVGEARHELMRRSGEALYMPLVPLTPPAVEDIAPRIASVRASLAQMYQVVPPERLYASPALTRVRAENARASMVALASRLLRIAQNSTHFVLNLEDTIVYRFVGASTSFADAYLSVIRESGVVLAGVSSRSLAALEVAVH